MGAAARTRGKAAAHRSRLDGMAPRFAYAGGVGSRRQARDPPVGASLQEARQLALAERAGECIRARARRLPPTSGAHGGLALRPRIPPRELDRAARAGAPGI